MGNAALGTTLGATDDYTFKNSNCTGAFTSGPDVTYTFTAPVAGAYTFTVAPNGWDAALYLLVLESRQSIRYSARAGERKPLHSSAIGKTLLGSLPDASLDAWLQGRALPRVTARTITSARALREDIVASRARGWYMTRGENVADVLAISAPLRLGGTLLGVAVAGPMHRMQPAHERIARMLAHCVRRLETDDVR